LDDNAALPSAIQFNKGFFDIRNTENTRVVTLKKDFILAAGNEGTCK